MREGKDRATVVEWSRFSSSFLERICEAAGFWEVPLLGRKNVTVPTGPDGHLDKRLLKGLDSVTPTDRQLLDQMAVDGLLRRCSSGDLEEEFRTTAERLRFRIA